MAATSPRTTGPRWALPAKSGTTSAATSAKGSGRAAQPGLFEHTDQFDRTEAQATVGLGSQEADGAQLGQDLPPGARRGVAGRVRGALGQGAQRADGALGVEDLAHALAQGQLVVGEGEAHGPVPRLQRGSPSRRSATTLR